MSGLCQHRAQVSPGASLAGRSSRIRRSAAGVTMPVSGRLRDAGRVMLSMAGLGSLEMICRNAS